MFFQELEGIRVKGKGCPKPIKTWAQCGVSKKMLEALKKQDYEKPTPIQAQAIPAIMSGRYNLRLFIRSMQLRKENNINTTRLLIKNLNLYFKLSTRKPVKSKPHKSKISGSPIKFLRKLEA